MARRNSTSRRGLPPACASPRRAASVAPRRSPERASSHVRATETSSWRAALMRAFSSSHVRIVIQGGRKMRISIGPERDGAPHPPAAPRMHRIGWRYAMRSVMRALLLATLLAGALAAAADDNPAKRCKNHYILRQLGCIVDEGPGGWTVAAPL